MTVDELRAALNDLPGEAEVAVWAEGRCVQSDELHVVGVGIDGDGTLRAFLDIDSARPATKNERGYYA